MLCKKASHMYLVYVEQKQIGYFLFSPAYLSNI